MKHVILGTAGHVDHGKTALIKALTGIDTDRLKEEKERGITIELGFAQLTLSSGQQVGIVDVPGHEKFVKNMVAGAGGIDVVALIIAADEGVMPQTREHLDICQLLGIRKGLAALTKIDLVDEEWRNLVIEDIKEFLQGTFLESSPVVPLSAVTGEGLSEFLSAMEFVIGETDERPEAGFFRLPVDRVFTMRGFGTVVTGTLLSGLVKIGDTVEIMPDQLPAKIRGIQIHNELSEVAVAGQRTAINLQGIEKETLQRGAVLATSNTFTPSVRMDVVLNYLPSAPRKLKNRTPVRFHTGTSEIIARIILFDGEAIAPGEEHYAQVLLDSPTIAMSGDRFVIRSYSPVTTIGGGEILDPLTQKHKRQMHTIAEDLSLLKDGTLQQKTRVILMRSGMNGITARELSVRTGTAPKRQDKILEEMFSKKEALLIDRDEQRVTSFTSYKDLQNRLCEDIASFHEKFPLKEGCPKEELRIRAGDYISSKLFNRAVRDLEKNGKIVVEKENVRTPEHRVALNGELDDMRGKIVRIYRESNLTPPATKDIVEQFPRKREAVHNVLNVMINERVLTKINEEMYFYTEHINTLAEEYKQFLLKNKQATPGIFREITGLSRKYTIPLMEYFDKTKLTIRIGDHRVLREKKENGN